MPHPGQHAQTRLSLIGAPHFNSAFPAYLAHAIGISATHRIHMGYVILRKPVKYTSLQFMQVLVDAHFSASHSDASKFLG